MIWRRKSIDKNFFIWGWFV